MSPDSGRNSPAAGLRFRSLELAAAISLDSRALARAMSRSIHSRTNLRADSFQSFDVGRVDGDTRLEYEWDVWCTSPMLWRDDVTYTEGDRIVCIVRPDAALAYISTQQTLYTSERVSPFDNSQSVTPAKSLQLPTLDQRLTVFPLIRPRLPASDWQLVSVGRDLCLGRPAGRLRAMRRADSIRSKEPLLSGFWEGVDEYECLIDDELQILLSVTGFVDGEPVAKISVVDMNVDTPIPAGTFDFSPPTGTHIARVAEE